jgi:hypothetical protein
MFLLFEALLGASAFAGLYLSNFDYAAKWFLGGGLLLLACLHDLRALQDDVHFEMLYRSLTAATTALERSGGDPESYRVADAIRNAEMKVSKHGSEWHINGATLVTLKYAFWVLGGWGVAAYVLPHLLPLLFNQ